VIDGLVDGSAWLTRHWSRISGWFDLRGVDGLVNFTAWFVGIWGRFVRLFQGGQLQRYILYTLVGVGIVLILSAFQ